MAARENAHGNHPVEQEDDETRFSDGFHDWLGNPVIGKITEAPDVLADKDTPAETRREWKRAIAKQSAVINRWLSTITPHLPASVTSSPEWAALVRQAKALPKGTPQVEAAREQVLQAWLWSGLERIADSAPTRDLRDTLKRFAQWPNHETRDQVLRRLVEHVQGLTGEDRTEARERVRTITRDGHDPTKDTHATVLVNLMGIARLSARERADYWRDLDPTKVLSDLVGAK